MSKLVVGPGDNLYNERGDVVAFSEAQLLDDAQAIQDACNLSGVVRAFNAATNHLWQWAHYYGAGTAFVNTHQVSKLYASKIIQLTGELK